MNSKENSSLVTEATKSKQQAIVYGQSSVFWNNEMFLNCINASYFLHSMFQLEDPLNSFNTKRS